MNEGSGLARGNRIAVRIVERLAAGQTLPESILNRIRSRAKRAAG